MIKNPVAYFAIKWGSVAALSVFFASVGTAAELTFPSVFSDHMVLQREQPVPIWGTADAGETIVVQFAGQTKTVVVDASNHWEVILDRMPASKVPAVLKISSKGKSEIINRKFTDVLVGEVWLCSGQSNMQFPMNETENGAIEIQKARSETIRLYHTPLVQSAFPLEKIDATWTKCTPESVKEFSAVAYYFGKKLNTELDVPIGLLHSSWGGTRIEPWTPPCGFEGIDALEYIDQMVRKAQPDSPEYKQIMSRYREQVGQWLARTSEAFERSEFISEPPVPPVGLILPESNQTATRLYNGMIHAHIPFAIRGAIWYQGESNRDDGMLYVEKNKALLKGWRSLWGYDFPFYFVQIAPYQYWKEDPEVLARFWEAQSEIVKQIPNTGMAIVSDATTLDDIHPRNKQIPGSRLALLALDNTYGKDVVSTGPVFKKMEKMGGALKIHFDSADGLTTHNGKSPDWFEIAGADRVFIKAKAKIVGESVVLTSPEVSDPLAVRFAWHKLAAPNLVNGAGLPTSAFRAGKRSIIYTPMLAVADKSFENPPGFGPWRECHTSWNSVGSDIYELCRSGHMSAAADGVWSGLMGTLETIIQNLGAVNAGDTLTVTFSGGRAKDTVNTAGGGVFTCTLDVGDSSNTVRADTTLLAEDTWQTYTNTWVCPEAGILSVKFSNVSGSSWLDNVSDVRRIEP